MHWKKCIIYGIESFEPKILAFCCHYCAYSSADLAGSMRIQYPPNVRIIRTPCTGRLETEYFMKALENGADGVLVAGCLEGGCHFAEGNLVRKTPGQLHPRNAGRNRTGKRTPPHGQCFRRHGTAVG